MLCLSKLRLSPDGFPPRDFGVVLLHGEAGLDEGTGVAGESLILGSGFRVKS